ncbi:MAG: hypothetical protein D4R84_13505 [Rhodocyclaceae bacterium]|nr:MAG: hypothetical protein D4R84_13505 [Rhodocyclaceae bacterium]
MFWPVIGISAAALGLVKLGMLTILLSMYKAMLAVALAVALLLGLGHVWRWHKDSRNGHHS